MNLDKIKNILKNTLCWVFAVLFVMASWGGILGEQGFLSNIVLLFSGILLIPPIHNLIFSKMTKYSKTKVSVILSIILLFISMLIPEKQSTVIKHERKEEHEEGDIKNNINLEGKIAKKEVIKNKIALENKISKGEIYGNTIEDVIKEEEKSTSEINFIERSKQEIKAIITRLFSGNNNLGKPFIRDLIINYNKDSNKFYVIFEFNANNNISDFWVVKGALDKMSSLYIALFSAKKDIAIVTMGAYFPVKNKYGYVEDKLFYKTKLTYEVAQRINWDADSLELEETIIPNLWQVIPVQ